MVAIPSPKLKTCCLAFLVWGIMSEHLASAHLMPSTFTFLPLVLILRSHRSRVPSVHTEKQISSSLIHRGVKEGPERLSNGFQVVQAVDASLGESCWDSNPDFTSL